MYSDLFNVHKHTYDCVNQEIFLLYNNFPINKCSKEENTLFFLSTFGEHNQDEICVTDVRRSSLGCQQLDQLQFCPLPCYPHLVASAEQMFYVLGVGKVFPPPCWVGAKIIIYYVLLKESRSATVDTAVEGEKQISLYDLQNFILES